MEWATTTVVHNAIATGTLETDDLLANFVADGGSREGLTVLRTHLLISYAPASVGALARIGLIVAPLASPTTAGGILDPSSNATLYEPWLLIDRLAPGASGATVNATNVYRLDNRSKRKVQHVQETYWFSWIPSDTGTSSISALIRVLVALP
jgi:hypothetical protein